MPAVCASSLAGERSACPNLTRRSAITPCPDPGERVDIGHDLAAAVDGRKKETGKTGDQNVRDIDSGVGDWDVNVGSRARGYSSIRVQGQVETDEGSRRWKGLFRDVVAALVNQES